MALDEIDLRLLEAWERLAGDERRVRWAERRRLRPVVRRPVRPWCLALRASDTRLERLATELRAVVEDGVLPADEAALYAAKHSCRSGRAGREVARTTSLRDDEATEMGLYPQRLVLSGAAVRALTAPVALYEETPIERAAALLGVTDAPVRRWVMQGTLRHRHVHPPGGRGGPPRVLVWSPLPLDPNRYQGRAADPAWGAAGMHERVPLDFTAALVRTPLVRRVRGELRNMGWTWVCPGRLMRDAGGELRRVGCGRTARTLYGPMPVWTLADYLIGREGGEAEGVAGAGGGGLAGLRSPMVHVARSFACEACWRPVRPPHRDVEATWNLFVTQVSGGLLRGADVARPAGALEGGERRGVVADGAFPLRAMPRPCFVEVRWYNCHRPEAERGVQRLHSPRKRKRKGPRRVVGAPRQSAGERAAATDERAAG